MADYSEDLTSGKTHYSNNAFGSPSYMQDDNLATYCQSMSYISVDGVDEKVASLKLAVHNSTALAALKSDNPVFQGSDNSTNGSDGDWTTITTLTDDDIFTPTSYPGWAVDKVFTNDISYSWYRLSGITQITNNVYNEWEMRSLVFVGYFSGYVYEQGVPAADRIIRAYNRSTGELMVETTSSGNGYYYLETTYSGAHYVVALDDDGGMVYNALIEDRLTPRGTE